MRAVSPYGVQPPAAIPLPSRLALHSELLYCVAVSNAICVVAVLLLSRKAAVFLYMGLNAVYAWLHSSCIVIVL